MTNARKYKLLYEHLLYDCSYVKPLWNIVDLVYGTKVNFIGLQMLGVDELFNYGSLTTLICFLIYKEWLLLSLENRKRNPVIALEYFKNEIKLRIQIYEKCIHRTKTYVPNPGNPVGMYLKRIKPS